jgi:hypothetical protein
MTGELNPITFRNKNRVDLRSSGLQQAAKIAFGKKILRPLDVDHDTFFGQDLSDLLIRIRLQARHVRCSVLIL